MPREFNTPSHYKSEVVTAIKAAAPNVSTVGSLSQNTGRRDFTPYRVSLPSLEIRLARYFGFCYGVENAIEVVYRAVESNPGKRIFILSEMIHNPSVNDDLVKRGVRFIQSTGGEILFPFEELQSNDVVVLPAFGVPVETLNKLKERGINTSEYDGTCPFVEKVWRRADQIGSLGYTVIVHGKHFHEETRATFSHSSRSAPSLIVRDMKEAQILAEYITGARSDAQLELDFSGKYSQGFTPSQDLKKIGVVNQTTMLAEETLAISKYLREIVKQHFGEGVIGEHFADTRDTLCYATSENQQSVKALVAEASVNTIALVIGGFKSSNTTHLAKICAQHVPTFHIEDSSYLVNKDKIRHMGTEQRVVIETEGWLPRSSRATVLITAGASTPNSVVNSVITCLAEFTGAKAELEAFVSALEINKSAA